MTLKDHRIKCLQEELRKEQIKTLKLRMRLSVLLQFPHGSAAEKIAAVSKADADFSESILYLN
jgi:hypothetical protein